MTDIRLTHAAMKALYASSCCLVVADGLVRKYRSCIPDVMQVFALSPAGVITVIDETVGGADETLAFIGMPAGLMGFVISPDQQTLAQSFTAYAALHVPQVMPAVHVVQGFGKAASLTNFINGLLAARVQYASDSLGQVQQQLAVLRRDYEQSKTMLEKAKRMMHGIGYGTRAVVYDLPVGDELTGPKPDAVQHTYVQELPVDLMGMSGLSLYVGAQTTDVKPDGELLLVIRRAADKKPVLSCVTPYHVFRRGWHRFDIAEPLTALGGEGELYLSWSGAGGPCFVKTSLTPDRFGDEAGGSLAVRVEKGLTNFSGGTAAPPADTMIEPALAYVNMKASDLFARGTFLGGQAHEADINARNGWPVLTADEQEGWLQTHLLADGLSGFHVPAALGPSIKQVGVTVALDHAKAAPCTVMLIAANPDTASTEETRALLAQLGSDTSLKANGTQGGLTWATATLYAEQQTQLKLLTTSDQPQDLIMLAKPLHAGKADFGWCRWQTLTTGYVIDDALSAASAPGQTAAMLHRMRVTTFPEIADRIVFYRGRYLHNKLRLDLGYLPVQIHNEFSAMQINPLKDGVCAAELIGGVPDDAVRMTCAVGTAHAQAARFTYIMGVVPQGASDRSAIIDGVAETVAGGMPTGNKDGVLWNSVTLPALSKQQLSLDLPASVNAGDIPFFCAVPSSGDTSYGWCRWYSLAFETRQDGAAADADNPHAP